MRGTIVRRGQKFYAVLDLPPGENGKRRQKWLSGFDTRRDAEAALAETLTEVHTGRYVEPTTMTVRQFLCDEWLPASTARVRATTLRGYRQAIHSYAVPALGDVPLAYVTPVMLTKLYGRLLTSGRANGKGGLSARTVRLLHTILRRALADAVRWRYLTSNPADGATPPSAAAARAPEMRTWTLAELQAFLRFTADVDYHVGYVLAACCGLRRGEVCGLRWSDIDLDSSGPFGPHLRVRQTLVEVDYVVSTSEPKTAKSRRVVALDATVVAILRRHRVRQHRDRLAVGAAYQDHDLVLARADGTPVQPSNFVQVFTRRVREAGVPHIRFHDLRHTHATLSLQGGHPPQDRKRAPRTLDRCVHPRHLQPRRAVVTGRGCGHVRRSGLRIVVAAQRVSLRPVLAVCLRATRSTQVNSCVSAPVTLTSKLTTGGATSHDPARARPPASGYARRGLRSDPRLGCPVRRGGLRGDSARGAESRW